jgi:Nitroreductase family
VAQVVKSQRRPPGGPSSREPGTLVPVGGVQTPTPRSAEHQGVCLAGEPIAADMLVEDLDDQAGQRNGATPGGRLGFGPVTAHPPEPRLIHRMTDLLGRIRTRPERAAGGEKKLVAMVAWHDALAAEPTAVGLARRGRWPAAHCSRQRTCRGPSPSRPGLGLRPVVLATAVLAAADLDEALFPYNDAVAAADRSGSVLALAEAKGQERTLLENFLAVYAAEGVAPGIYRSLQSNLEQIEQGTFRHQAAHLCLDQPLGGDCAFDAFHCAALGDVIERTGARGYRSALLEAGTAMGRLQLAAYALGDGASGITFYDDEVSAFLQTQASPMLVTTVGVPGYRARPGKRPADMERLRVQLT